MIAAQKHINVPPFMSLTKSEFTSGAPLYVNASNIVCAWDSVHPLADERLNAALMAKEASFDLPLIGDVYLRCAIERRPNDILINSSVRKDGVVLFRHKLHDFNSAAELVHFYVFLVKNRLLTCEQVIASADSSRDDRELSSQAASAFKSHFERDKFLKFNPQYDVTLAADGFDFIGADAVEADLFFKMGLR